MNQPSLGLISSGYQTRITNFVAPVAGPQLLLAADPRRWAVRFEPSGFGAYTMGPTPGPMPGTLPVGTGLTAPIEFHWRDYPSWLIGEWYVDIGVGTTIVIWECLFLG